MPNGDIPGYPGSSKARLNRPKGSASNYTGKAKPTKTPLVGKTTAKQAAYYHQQRLHDESVEKRGGRGQTAAATEAAKIHGKLGRKLTGIEADVTQRPGPSEGEQMGMLALGLDPVFGAMRGLLRGAAEVAVKKLPARLRQLPEGTPTSTLAPAMRTMKQRARVVSAKVENPTREALPAPKYKQRAKSTTSAGERNPRAMRTNPRAAGKNPRARTKKKVAGAI